MVLSANPTCALLIVELLSFHIYMGVYGKNHFKHFTRAPWTPIDSHQLSMIKHDDRSQASEARGENQAVATVTT